VYVPPPPGSPSSPRPTPPGPNGTPWSPPGFQPGRQVGTGLSGVYGQQHSPGSVTKKWGLFSRAGQRPPSGNPGWRPPTIAPPTRPPYVPPPPGQQPLPVPQPPPKDPGAALPQPAPPIPPPPIPPPSTVSGVQTGPMGSSTLPTPSTSTVTPTTVATGSQLQQPITGSAPTKGGTFTAQASTAPQQLQQQTFTAQAAPPPQMQAPTTTTQGPAFPVQASTIDGSNPLDVNGDGHFDLNDVGAGIGDTVGNVGEAVGGAVTDAAGAAGDVIGQGGAWTAEQIASILSQWNAGWDAGMGGAPAGQMQGLEQILGNFGFGQGSLVGDVGQNWTTAMDPEAWEQRANNLMATASEQGWADLNRQERRLNSQAALSGIANTGGMRGSIYNNLTNALQNQQRNIWNDSLLQQMQALQGAGSFANQQQAMDQARWSQMLGMLGQANQADTQYAQDQYLGFGEALGGILGVGANVAGQGANGVGTGAGIGAGGMSELFNMIGKLGIGGFGI
jgi:hypothetical protein